MAKSRKEGNKPNEEKGRGARKDINRVREDGGDVSTAKEEN